MDVHLERQHRRSQSQCLFFLLRFTVLLATQICVESIIDCDQWRDSGFGHFAQLVSVVSHGYHFCGGMVVDPSWVVSSYSCIQNMMLWSQIMDADSQLGQWQEHGCGSVGNNVSVNSIATANCRTYGDLSEQNFQSSIEFGVRYPLFDSMDIPNMFDANVSAPLYINDLVLLKLSQPMEWMEDFPIEVTANEVTPEQMQNAIELITWRLSKPDGSNEEAIPSLLSQGSSFGLHCDKFLNLLQNGQILDGQQKGFVGQFGEDLYCMQYEVPLIKDQTCRTFHAGDPVIIKEEQGFGLLGLLTEGFVHPETRDNLQPNDDYNRHYCYSQEDVGNPFANPEERGLVMFLSFTQENLYWLNNIVSNYTHCPTFKQAVDTNEPLAQEPQSSKHSFGSTVCIVLGVVLAIIIGIYVTYRIRGREMRANNWLTQQNINGSGRLSSFRDWLRSSSLGRSRRYSSFRDSTVDTENSGKELALRAFNSRESNEGEIQLRKVPSKDLNDTAFSV